jgi:hypothetical protein
VQHAREIRWDGAEVAVRDEVSGTAADLFSFLHFHPACELHPDGATIAAHMPGARARIELLDADVVSLVRGAPDQGWYFPTFGEAVPAPVLVLRPRRGPATPFGYRIRLREA